VKGGFADLRLPYLPVEFAVTLARKEVGGETRGLSS
jgi:hypothetical protein